MGKKDLGTTIELLEKEIEKTESTPVKPGLKTKALIVTGAGITFLPFLADKLEPLTRLSIPWWP